MSPVKVRHEDESRVLVLYTSGAIGMKINENGGNRFNLEKYFIF
jgi:hypothetical protein